MLAFLTRLEAQARFHGAAPEGWIRLFDYLTTEPKPGVGLMRWFSLFADEKKLLSLAANLQKTK
jgi:hypothetical protein